MDFPAGAVPRLGGTPSRAASPSQPMMLRSVSQSQSLCCRNGLCHGLDYWLPQHLGIKPRMDNGKPPRRSAASPAGGREFDSMLSLETKLPVPAQEKALRKKIL